MAKASTSQWRTDPREALRVGSGFDLASLDRAATPGWDGDKADAQQHMDARGELLSELQERLFAEGRAGGNRSVLVIVQGIDTAGKGGIARHVIGYVDPQGVQLRSFGVPTEQERRHHFLWRIRKALPTPGHIGVFDRSHYEDVLVVRVDNLVEQEVWEKRYAQINRFEKRLVESGTLIIKIALMVSHAEQGLRLMERIDRPDKRWKFNPGDIDTRGKWDAYQEAYQAVLDRTNTDWAPWYVLPADRKWYPRLALTEILTRELVELAPTWPAARWRADVQRRNLARTMTTKDLATSLAGTESVVTGAIEASIDVRDEAAEVLGASAQLSDRRAQRREDLLAEMHEAIRQKEELLADRTDAPAPGKKAKDKSKKAKGKGRKAT